MSVNVVGKRDPKLPLQIVEVQYVDQVVRDIVWQARDFSDFIGEQRYTIEIADPKHREMFRKNLKYYCQKVYPSEGCDVYLVYWNEHGNVHVFTKDDSDKFIMRVTSIHVGVEALFSLITGAYRMLLLTRIRRIFVLDPKEEIEKKMEEFGLRFQ